MATNDPKIPKLGDSPTGYRRKTPEEMLGDSSAGPLIGGKGSSAVGSFLGNVAQGAAGVLAAPFKAIDRGLAAAAGVEYRDEIASPIGKLGQGIEAATESVAAGDPERADQFVSKLGQGLGSTLGFAAPLGLVGAGARGVAASAGLGATATGVESAEDYEAVRKQAGLPVEKSDQAAAFFYGLLPGTLEAAPLARMFGRLDNVVEGGLSAAIKNTAKGTAEEALQEGIQSTAQNLIASDIVRYDADRDMFFDTPEAAAVGGGVGFIINSIFSAMGLRKRGGAGEQAAEIASVQGSERLDPEAEKKAAALNPVTDQELQTGELQKVNLQINRFEKLARESTGDNAQQYLDRIEAIKADVRKRYLAKDDKGEFIKPEVERQEAEDVVNRIGVEEVEQIEAAPAPVAEAEPFPGVIGRKEPREINDPKAVKKFNKALAETQVEEIDLADTDLPVELPTSADLIKTEEVDAEIEEIALDTTPDVPDRETFLADKPSNTVFADALQSVKEQRKLRAETDEAFEKRKQLEIAEAYRQRELQRAEEQFEEEQPQEEVVQQAAVTPVDALPTEQAQEPVPAPKTPVTVTPEEAQALDLANGTRQRVDDFEERLEARRARTEPKATKISRLDNPVNQIANESDYTAEIRALNMTEDQKQELINVAENAGLDYEKNPQNWENYEEALNAYIGGWYGEQSEPTAQEVQKSDAAQAVEEKADPVPAATATTPPATSTKKTAEVEEWKQPSNWGTTLSSLSKATGRNFGFLPRDTYPGLEKAIDLGIKDHALFDKKTGVSVESRIIDRVEKFLSTEYNASPEIMDGFQRGLQNMVTTGPARVSKVEKPDAVKAKKDNVPLVGKGLIGRKDGSVFATERSAKSARTRLKLTDADQIVAVEGGFAIKPAQDGLDAYSNLEQAKQKQTEPSRVFKHENQEPVETDLVIEDEPPKKTIDPEVYNTIMVLSEKMAKDPRPERFTPYIQKHFGSVRQFINLRTAIMNDELVPGKTEEVKETPVGEVENTDNTEFKPEVVQAVELRQDPVQVAENVREDTAADLAEINQKIENLERVMASSANPDKLMNRLDTLMAQREAIENKLGVDSEEVQKAGAFSKEEIDELVRIDQESEEIGYDDDFMYLNGKPRGPAVRKEEIAMGRRVVEKFKSSLASEFKDQIEIYYVNSAEDIPIKYRGLRNTYQQKYSQSGRGVIWTPKTGGPQVVLIFGRDGLTPSKYEWTLFHEVVGHFGVQKLFAGEFNKFLDLALRNKDLASRAYSMRTRWPNIELGVSDPKDAFTVESKYDYLSNVINHPHKYRNTGQSETVIVSKEGMRLLMDEYIAELAGQVSMGDFNGLAKQEKGFVRRIVAWFRHLLRKSGFGRIAPKISDGDLLAVIKASYQNLTRDPVFTEGNKLTPLAQEAQEMTDEVINASVASGLLDENAVNGMLRSMDSREGRIDNHWWQQKVDSYTNRIRRGWLGKHFSSTGHLPHPSHLAAVENKAKGSISKADQFADKWFKLASKLTDIEKRAVMQYFTTRDADPNQVPESVRSLAVDAKQTVDDLGQELVRLGVLRRSTYEENAGQYLPIRYYKYLGGYTASGKKLSFRNYLKQRSDLSDAEKQALGKIEDPSILVAETVATLSRDVALHQMYRNMLALDQQGSLGWFIQNLTRIQVGDRKMTFDDIERNIERLDKQMALADGEQPLNINEEGRLEMERQMAELQAARDQVIHGDRRAAAVRAMRADGFDGEVTDEMVSEYMKGFTFVKDPAYGPLMNKWVKNELAQELEDQQVSFNGDSIDFFAKWMGPGGKMERASIYWKKLKVAANPPSVFRNFWGNFILLDMGTTTNTLKLLPKLMKNIKAWATGDSSNPYLTWANDYGLYGTTYSTAELNEIQTRARQRWESVMRTADPEGDAKAAFWNKFVLPGRAFNKYVEAATQFYGNMEGWFKMTAMQDHVEIWERQNGRSIHDLNPQERDAVLREAAATANKNIFDYSKVPGWMRSMRRMPFVGAPFLTFTFKAIPQSIESFARRPQKFIKYAMFPYLMAQAFMTTFDVDDDDMKEIQRLLPKWMKEKSSVFLVPWKDSNGNWVAMDFGYLVPWAPMIDMMYMAQNTFDVRNPLMSTGHTALNAVTNLGFLGGPVPTMISGILTNKDPFLGTEIIRTTGTALDKQNDLVRYMVDLWAPSFLTSKGVLGRTMDNLGIQATPLNTGREFTRSGQDRETAGQVASRIFGFNQTPVNRQEGLGAMVRAYQFERGKIAKARSKIAKDPNISPQDKIRKIRELNEQLKVLNKKHREDMRGE